VDGAWAASGTRYARKPRGARLLVKPRNGLADSHKLKNQASIDLMRTNSTRERLARGEVVYGCGLQVYRAPEIPRAFQAAGFDYVFIDMEHGSYNLETVHDMIIASKLAGITPIVRVGELQYTLCARLLDQGAQGIILPRVEDARVLEEALSWLRFPPLGKRGFGVNPTMVDYETRGMAEIIEHQNRETLSVVQFETVLAVERADELLSLKGLDVMMIGPADLSISLGIPGQFDNPLLIETVDKVIAKCNQHGVVPGIQTRGVAMAKMWVERGMRFVGVAAEHVFLLEKCKETIAALRG
jgi:2-keto-3-deoxy-L-rhamnonate aldolase RhmA